MEKNDLLRVRVTPRLREDFEAICKTFDMTAADVLRDIVDRYVQENLPRLGDRIVINISRPTGYDLGAYRVFIKLRFPEEASYNGKPIPFRLPELKMRRMASDDEYRSIVGVPDAKQFVKYEMGGVFINGEWRGHLYTNGIEEKQNPTPIEVVKSVLVESLAEHFDRFKS